MIHASLFSGIGGFDLAAEWMGWINAFHCDINKFSQKILKYYWPDAVTYGDIKTIDFSPWRRKIDILTGGFPCQPYSTAGKRLGKNDERHLWPYFLRAIRQISPSWVVGENVSGILNWNGGVVFEEVCAELEAEGYEVQPFVLPAAGVNAPHKRDRVWFIAFKNPVKYGWTQRENEFGNGFQKYRNAGTTSGAGVASDTSSQYGTIPIFKWGSLPKDINTIRKGECRTAANSPSEGRKKRKQGNGRENIEEKGTGLVNEPEQSGRSKLATYTQIKRGRWKRPNGCKIEAGRCDCGNGDDANATCERFRDKSNWAGKSGFAYKNGPSDYWHNFPTQSPICGGNDGLPRQLDGITFSSWRRKSLEGYGNAIVPQVALQIFQAIQAVEQNLTKTP